MARRLAPHWPWLLLLLLLGLGLAGPPVTYALRIEPARGWHEGWRWLSGHFVHLGWKHAALNGASLIVFSRLLPALHAPLRAAWIGLGSLIGVDLGIALLHPQLPWYVGFSGAVYGLLIGGAVEDARRGSRLAALVGAGVLVKLAFDASTGPAAWSSALVGGKIMVEAHVYGAIGGGLFALVDVVRGGNGIAGGTRS